MTVKQFIAFLTRLFAVWLLLEWVLSYDMLSFLLQASAPLAGRSHMLLAIFNALLLLGCAVLLWRYPLWFAGKIVPPAQADDRLDLSASAMLRVALIVAGVWLLLARALPNMAFYMGEISSLSSTPAWRVVTRASHFSYMMLIAGVIQTLLAGILMFKTDSVMRLLGGRNGVAETPPATRQ